MRLDGLAKEAETRERERMAAEREYLSAIRESRLYAAERSLQAIEAAADGGPPPAGADDLRRKLAAVQRELGELRQAATHSVRGETLIGRYLDLLTRCRDCREALLALQSIPIESPAPPEGLAIRREGNRRILSWKPADSGRRPTSYVVQHR